MVVSIFWLNKGSYLKILILIIILCKCSTVMVEPKLIVRAKTKVRDFTFVIACYRPTIRHYASNIIFSQKQNLFLDQDFVLTSSNKNSYPRLQPQFLSCWCLAKSTFLRRQISSCSLLYVCSFFG